MKPLLLVVLLLLFGSDAQARSPAPLHNPVALNIGLSCQWQQRCIKTQNRAMKRALKFVKKYRPPAWKIQLCNRNAARRRFRVDWVGFDNCIRNQALRPPPIQAKTRRRR